MKRRLNVFISAMLCICTVLQIIPINVSADTTAVVSAVTTGKIKYIDSYVQYTFDRALNNTEIEQLNQAEFMCTGSGEKAQITPVYDSAENILTIKYGELETLMYSEKTTKPAEYKLVLPEEYFINSDTVFTVGGSKLFEYLTVGENFSESTGITVTDADTTFEFVDKTDEENGYIKAVNDFVLYGLKSTMSVNFYIDICVNTKDIAEDGAFNVMAANCNGQSAWITLMNQKQGGLWNGSIDAYKDENGWAEFRICMQKDSSGNYIKSIYNKDKNGVYRLAESPKAVYCSIDRQSQKVNRISWLTISGQAGVKISNIRIYKENPKNLTPKIESVSYNEDGAEVVFSRHMLADTINNENIMIYNTSGEVIENADFDYNDLTKTLSITNSGVIDRISYGNNVIAVNGMPMAENTESYSCVMSDLTIVNDDGELITSLAEVTNASAVFNVENYNSDYSDKVKTVVIAAYDSDGRLIATDFDTKEISIGVTGYSADISFGSDVAKLKTFLWDGDFNEMKPSDKAVVTVPGTQSVSIESVSGAYNAVIMKPGSNTAYVRGLRKQISAPFMSGSSIMVDLEDIAEITLSSVETNGETKTVYYTDKEISFTAGSSIMGVVDRGDKSENDISMSAFSQLTDGTMYVPVNDYLNVIGMTLNPYINDHIVFGDGELVTRSFSDYELTVLESLFADDFNENVVATFYVDSAGDDRNDGTEESPFKTIEEAVAAVRSYKESNGMTGDIEVLIKNGTYYTDGITLSAEDSGENGYNVIYSAYPGHMPKIVSGERVTDWELHEDNIYKAKVNRTDFEVLIENDTLSHPARYPDYGYNKSIAMPGGAVDTAFAFAAGDIPELKNEENTVVSIWPGGANGTYSWRHVFTNVSDIDYDSGIVYTVDDTGTVMGVNSRYFIENDYNLLSCEGEFYSDGEYLYYIPYSNDINESEIIIANQADIFTLSGESYNRRVKNIEFFGLTFMGADRNYNGIDITYASGITIKECRFKNIGKSGVSADRSYDVTVKNSEFKNIGNDGVALKGQSISDKTISGFHTVLGNSFEGLGKVDPGEAAGVSAAAVDNCYIAYNKISDSPRFGIDVSSNKADIKETNISYDEWEKYIRGQNTVVEGNDISDVCKDSMDGGAIYMWCAGTGNVIRRNRLHHSTSPISYWFPVYLDDGSDGTVIYDNVVDNNQNYESDGYIMHLFFFKGVENVMFNNIAVNNQNFEGASKDFSTFGTHSMANYENDRVKNVGNIFYNCGDNFVHIERSVNSGIYYTPMSTRIAEQDKNMHYNESGIYLPDIAKKEDINITNLEEWLAWQNGKYDQNSLFGVNPEFIDVQSGDFRLSPESKAYELGFSDIDFGSIGLPKEYPFADSRDILESMYIITSNKKNSIEKMAIGDIVSLNVTGRTEKGFFTDSSNAEVSYVSSDDTVAAVDETGKVTALSVGSATVTAKMQYNGVTKNISIDILVN